MKVIIISAPSGCGKSTIINAILAKGEIDMEFSISATNRSPREGEAHGVNYYFLTTEDFRRRIADGEFVEYEEVYPGRYYGTLRSEVDRILDGGHNCILDIDVKGALNVKRIYGDRALSIFIMPPSVETLRQRLMSRATDSIEEIERRVAKADEEISYAPLFDVRVVNDNLSTAVTEVETAIKNFLAKP